MEKITLEQFENGESAFLVSDELIPITTKIACAELVADEACIKSESGILVCDEVLRDIYSELYGISLYTNIDIEVLSTDIYDRCEANGLIKQLYEQSEDYKKFIDICNKVCTKREKENNLANEVASYVKNLTKYINNSLIHVNDLLDRIDPNEFNNAFGKSLELFVSKMPNLNDEKTLGSALKLMNAIKQKKA